MKTLRVSMFSVIFLALFFACSNRNSSTHDISSSDQALEEVVMPELKLNSEGGDKDETAYDQKVIKTGHVRFETKSIENTYTFVKSLLVKYDGYIQNDNSTRYGNTLERSLQVRIPSKAFQPLVDTLSTHVLVFDQKEINLQDVTEEYVDLEARLKAKRELENRYLELLQKANSIKDMLEIERQLSLIREEIEAQQGRLKFLDNRVSLSTLNINFYKKTDDIKAPSQRFLTRFGQSFVTGFKWLGDFIIGLMHFWPFIIIGLGLFIFIRRKFKKK